MEIKLDELLHSLHRYQFADAEQIVAELRHFMLTFYEIVTLLTRSARIAP